MSLRHNKKRNAFIIYEQLIALTTRLAAAGNKEEASSVIAFIKEHYKSNTEIGKEFKLLEAILSPGGHTKDNSEKIIEESIKQAKTLTTAKLEKEKTKLIEDVNKHISKDLFKIPLKDYKAAASAQILLNESRHGKIETSPVERVKIRSILVDKISKSKLTESDEKIDNVTFAILCSKFNQRYSKLMNDDQKETLSAWSTFLIDGNEEKANSILNEKVNKLKLSLSSHMSLKKHKQAEHEPLLKEAYSKLVDSDFSLNEQCVYEVMRFFDLVEDLDNYDAQKEA